MVIKKISGFEKPILEEKINLVNIPHGVNFYDILGVDRTASKGKITKAFNELSLNEHPDKKGGVRTEKFDLLEKAKSVLLESKNEYNNLIDNEGWLDKSNNGKFRNKIINLLDKKIVYYNIQGTKYDATNKYLPNELRNWRTEISNAIFGISYEVINSYANSLIEIFSSCLDIENKYKYKKSFNLPQIVQQFAGLQTETEIKQTYNKIIQEFQEKEDNGTGEEKETLLKRQKVEELKNLTNFFILIKYEKDKYFEERILNSFAEKGHWGNVVKSLEQVINDVLKDAKISITSLLEKEKKDNKLNPIKEDYIKKLHRLNGWNELLEPWEQDNLEAKINNISEDKISLFDNCITYAQKVFLGGHLRKYRAGFWNKLEELTDLKKEDIFQEDGGDGNKGKKIGERYEYISKHAYYKGIEPGPKALDGQQFEKMKLFICYYTKEASSRWHFLFSKLNNMGYDKDVDSGWMPSKRNNNLLKYQQNEAIKVIEKEIRLKEKGKEDGILGINWKKRFEIEGDTEKKIKAIKEDFLDKISCYRNNSPCPWKGGENLSPPTDPLKEEKEQAKAKILKEAFDNDPVINNAKLEKDNQNWENDINNASKKEEIIFIKLKVIDDIQNKRVKEKEKNTLDELISKAKKGENWNNYQNLKNLLKQIKKLQSSDLYKKNKSEIYAIEKRIKELNPEDFSNSIKDDLNKKLTDNDLSQEETSNQTKALIDEAIESGNLEKKLKAEEAIIQEGTDKKLNNVIVIVKEAIKKGNLTNDQKEELITKILEHISKNEYQQKSYQKQKNKVDKLLSELRGETTEEQENSGVSWKKNIGIAVVISLSITILVSVAMKISAHHKRRNIQ